MVGREVVKVVKVDDEEGERKLLSKTSTRMFTVTAAARGAPHHDQRSVVLGGRRRWPFVSISISWIANANSWCIR